MASNACLFRLGASKAPDANNALDVPGSRHLRSLISSCCKDTAGPAKPLAPSKTVICRPFAYVVSFMCTAKRLRDCGCRRNKSTPNEVRFVRASESCVEVCATSSGRRVSIEGVSSFHTPASRLKPAAHRIVGQYEIAPRSAHLYTCGPFGMRGQLRTEQE